jgi:hypothetical protein
MRNVIYLYRNNQQEGPFEESVIREWLQTAKCSPNDLAIREGLSEWQPLIQLLNLQMFPEVNPPTSRLKNEIALLYQYCAEIGDLIDNIAECDSQAAKPLQIHLEQKMQIYWRQIYLIKTQFPGDQAGSINEAKFYYFQALMLFNSSGLMRRASDRSESLAFGLATGLIAKQQEKKNAQHALALLDKALNLHDFALFHIVKAGIFRALVDNHAAVYELNYVIANFPDDEMYVEARRIKAEIENSPQKGCFIATAAFGSPLANEVVLLSRYRDEVLMHSSFGRYFVKTYYRISPPLSILISKTNILRKVTRKIFLSPLIELLKKYFQI